VIRRWTKNIGDDATASNNITAASPTDWCRFCYLRTLVAIFVIRQA